MSRTAYHEHYGSSLEALALAEDESYHLRAPTGPGGCRFYSLEASDRGVLAVLPSATRCGTGGPVFVVHSQDASADSIDVVDFDSNIIATIGAGELVELHLVDNSTNAGQWVANLITAAEMGVQITLGRVVYNWRVDADQFDFHLQDHANAAGWDGVTPAAMRLTIGAGYTFGASTSSEWGFDTGDFPAGSSLMLILEDDATITGRGGAGGSGGDIPPGTLAQNGSAGGAGMRIGQCNVRLVSYGTIQGGGGGGGGGAADAQRAGGGGGGGAGFTYSQGGREGTGGGATAGVSGSTYTAGGGGQGHLPGGTGGAPGTAGAAGSAAGGAAGDAIQRATAYTLTKIRAGTITGAETTF